MSSIDPNSESIISFFSKRKRAFAPILGIAVSFLLYQNCGGGNSTGSDVLGSNTVSNAGTSTTGTSTTGTSTTGTSTTGTSTTGTSTTGTSTSGTPSTATFRLINSTGLSINFAYITPSSSSSWGSNLLPSDLVNNSSYDFTGFNPDTYDGKAVIVANSIYNAYLLGANVSSGEVKTVTSIPSAYSGSLKIINGAASHSISQLYLALPSDQTWGPNQISSSVTPGNYTHIFDLAPTTFEMLVVWDDNTQTTYSNINIQSLSLLTGTALY